MSETLLTNFLLVTMAMALAWRIAVWIGDVSFIDAVWGFGMGLLTATSWWQLTVPGASASLIASMAMIWGLRLGWHLFTRWRGQGEDARYAKILGGAKAEGRFADAALKRVFGPQALLLYMTCLPAQLGILANVALEQIGGLTAAGLALWLVGMVFEVIGDAQLKAFRANPDNRGRVLDTGLWRYTRHPNYFGDAAVWWGIWLASAEAGLWTMLASLPGPLFLTFTLTRWSGKPLLEAGLAKSRPGYADYVARTSGFIPWWPKRPRP